MEEIKPAAAKAARRKPVRSRKTSKPAEASENLQSQSEVNVEPVSQPTPEVTIAVESQLESNVASESQNSDDGGEKKRQPRRRKYVSKKKAKEQLPTEPVADSADQTPAAPVIEAIMVSESQPESAASDTAVSQVQETVVSETAVEVVHVAPQNPIRRSMRAERQREAQEAQATQPTQTVEPVQEMQAQSALAVESVDELAGQNVETVVVTVGEDQGSTQIIQETTAEQPNRKSRRRRRSRRKKDKNKVTAENGQEQQVSQEQGQEPEPQDQPEEQPARHDESDNKRKNKHKRDRRKGNTQTQESQQDEEQDFLGGYGVADNLNDIYSLDDDEELDAENESELRGGDDFVDQGDQDVDDEDDDEVPAGRKDNGRNIRSKKSQNQASSADGEHAGKKQRREMLINISAGQECRIAVVEEGKLEELYVERLDATSLVGNIYKGRIVNIEPSIQACFVDFGIGQNGFLHISDVQTSYFRNSGDHSEKVGKKQPRKERPLIQECLRKGQEVVVQVIKAGIGTKGPTLSTYISIPGRYVVLMPGMSHSGVSRKLSQEDRQKMKELSAELSAPEDVGIILRTASLDSNKRDLKKDFNYLLRLWKQMSHHINNKKTGPMELYKESDLVIRTIRDVFTAGIDRIYCDNENTWNKINDFFAIAMPRSRDLVKLYTDHVPLFTKYNIEKEIEKLQSKNVPLPHGGSIVIESTEAMVTIDVNSGKYRDNNNAEDTAYKINLVAADEICRQLKLRDLGGVIVVDFIDMVNNKHKRDLEKLMRDLFARDRASTRILRINQFGLMAITRQRMKASLKNRTYTTCPLCKGAGQLKSSESVAIEAMRKIAYAVEEPQVSELDVMVAPQVAAYLLNERRHALVELEQKFSKRITIKIAHESGPEDIAFDARNGRGIRIDPWL